MAARRRRRWGLHTTTSQTFLFSIAAVLLLLFAAYCAVCSLLLLLLLSASASVRPSAVLHFLAFSLVRGGVNTNRESGFPPPLSLFPPSSHRVSSPSSCPSKRAEREANSSISPPSVLVGSQASTGKGRKEGNGVEERRPFCYSHREKEKELALFGGRGKACPPPPPEPNQRRRRSVGLWDSRRTPEPIGVSFRGRRRTEVPSCLQGKYRWRRERRRTDRREADSVALG